MEEEGDVISELPVASAYIMGSEERRRLEVLEECLDPITAQSLEAIGVAEGWRCLEVGAGGGSVTRMLCRRVGPSGLVTAVDLDTRFVDGLGEDNLAVHQRDVLAAGLPGRGYDLIHARLLLMHLPTREKFVEEMAAALRPGGWLLIEELDFFSLAAMWEGIYAEVFGATLAAFEAAGVANYFGRQLPRLFDRAGLEDVDVICQVPVYRGGTAFAELNLLSIAQLRPAILAAGATEDQLEEFTRVIRDRTQWFTHFAQYSVRGRAPSA
ncbi:MAG: methyltransferase domain-containing protein [Actinobacteria bacterium]|nr:methyltransferase domain-containing protein [Actinomycetota bacterium]